MFRSARDNHISHYDVDFYFMAGAVIWQMGIVAFQLNMAKNEIKKRYRRGENYSSSHG